MNTKIKGIVQISLAILFASVLVGTLIAKYIGFSSILANPAPIKCSDKRVQNVRNCSYTEAGGPAHCDKLGRWCRVERYECEYDRWPEYGGGTGYCLKDTKNVCGKEDDERCKPKKTPSSTETPRVTSTPVVTSTPIVTSTPVVTSTPGIPNNCGGTCGSNSNCQGGLFCSSGYCRNPECAAESDCNCKVTQTPTVPPVLGVTAPPKLPKTGGEIGTTFSLFGIASLGVYIFRKFKLI